MEKKLLLAAMVGVMALLPRAGWAYPTYHENYHDFKGENGLWYVINDDKTTVRVTYREPFQLNYTPNETVARNDSFNSRNSPLKASTE